MRVLEWVFALVALWFAWGAAMERFLAWYSGMETGISPTRWWLAISRIVVFVLAALVVIATECLVDAE